MNDAVNNKCFVSPEAAHQYLVQLLQTLARISLVPCQHSAMCTHQFPPGKIGTGKLIFCLLIITNL